MSQDKIEERELHPIIKFIILFSFMMALIFTVYFFACFVMWQWISIDLFFVRLAIGISAICAFGCLTQD